MVDCNSFMSMGVVGAVTDCCFGVFFDVSHNVSVIVVASTPVISF